MNYIVSCKNMEGGFGCTPGGESHSGQSIFNISYLLSIHLLLKMFEILSSSCLSDGISLVLQNNLYWTLKLHLH